MLEYCQLDPWEHTFKQMHLKMSPAKSRPSFLDLSALTAAVASDSFDPVVHYVKVTHWPNGNAFTHPLVPECPRNIKSLLNRKQLAFYMAYSDKIINWNLVHHHEPNGSTKGKLSNRNQETNICLYLYPGTCTQVHVWLNVLLFIPLLYHMLHFCCFYFFSMLLSGVKETWNTSPVSQLLGTNDTTSHIIKSWQMVSLNLFYNLLWIWRMIP